MATPNKAKTDKPVSTKPKKEIVVDNSPEGKAARFKKIAGRRTQKIVLTLSNLGNCANRNVYGYTQEQIDYIFAAIEKQVKTTREKFAEKIESAKPAFDIDKAGK